MDSSEPVASDTDLLQEIFGGPSTLWNSTDLINSANTTLNMTYSKESSDDSIDSQMQGSQETTENGFYDENGTWQDMTDYVPDAAIKAIVDTVITESQTVSKVGTSAADSSNDFYSEEDAKQLSTFDIKSWLDKKGQTDRGLDTDNRQLLSLSLQDLYPVPTYREVTSVGTGAL